MDLKELIEGYRELPAASVADAVDAVVGRAGFMSGAIRQAVPGKLVGPAATVLEGPGDRAGPPIHALMTIDESDPGTVVVIGLENQEGSPDVAVWGGLMTTAAVTRGLGGAVLDAGLRDLEETRQAGFPVFCRSVVPASTVGRYVTVDRGVPVVCGSALVRPGDIVVGDADGVVVVPRDAAEEVLASARQVEAAEQAMEEAIRRTGSIITALEEFGRI
ncbi:MAG: RraA family protein [Acidimicrobiia bacterium]